MVRGDASRTHSARTTHTPLLTHSLLLLPSPSADTARLERGAPRLGDEWWATVPRVPPRLRRRPERRQATILTRTERLSEDAEARGVATQAEGAVRWGRGRHAEQRRRGAQRQQGPRHADEVAEAGERAATTTTTATSPPPLTTATSPPPLLPQGEERQRRFVQRQEDSEVEIRSLLRPDMPFRRRWDAVMLLLVAFAIVTLPLRLAFQARDLSYPIAMSTA